MRMSFLFVIAAVGVTPWALRAQEAPSAGGCPSIAADSERLACYDRALRGTQPPTPTATPAASPTAPAQAATPAPVPTGAAAAATAGAAATTATAPPVQVNVQPPSSSLSTAPRTNPRNATAPSPQPAPAVESGANPPVGIVPIVVLGTREVPGRGVEFTTDRGDVWVQADTQRLQLPPTPFNAEIKPGTFGSVFLVPDKRLGIRVRHHD
jgi:hypothetical protein